MSTDQAKRIRCPVCDGTGIATPPFHYEPGALPPLPGPCPNCSGTGYVEDPPPTLSGDN
jgi:DnaJ-class molecular chaperone